MKYRLFIIPFLLGLFAACSNDDDVRFDVTVDGSAEAIRFTAAPGGAIMRYSLPENKDIFGIRIRYTNAWGEAVMKDGSYLNDSLVLEGFTDACQEVVAQVSYFNRAMEESEVVERTFSTEKSATVAIFDNLTVNSFWGGFNVTYTAPELVNGLIHIFYVGENPTTHEPDSILKASLAIVEGGDTLNFPMKQEMDYVDVVVRTDDFKGRRVKQKIVEKVAILKQDTLTPEEFKFSYTGKAIENDKYKLGTQYLFDGDKKGKKTYEARKSGGAGRHEYYTYLTDAGAFSERFIVDLLEEKVPAAINLYAFVCLGKETNYTGDSYVNNIWSGKRYITRLPSRVKVYGTNSSPETTDLNLCTLLASYSEADQICAKTAKRLNSLPQYDREYIRRIEYSETWAWRTDNDNPGEYALDKFGARKTLVDLGEAEFDAEEPVCLNLLCNYTGEKYRYLIMVVEDTFASFNYNTPNQNEKQYVTFNELEVCVKAESNN